MVITSSKYRFPRTIISNQLIGNIVIECMRIINYSIDYELQKDGCLFCRRTGITTNLVMSTMIPRPVIAFTLSMIYRLSRPCNNTLWNDSTSLAALTMYPRPVFAITLSTIYRLSRPCNNTVWNDSFFRRYESHIVDDVPSPRVCNHIINDLSPLSSFLQ